MPETLKRTLECVMEFPAGMGRLSAMLRRMSFLGTEFSAFGMSAGLAVLGRLGNLSQLVLRDPSNYVQLADQLVSEEDKITDPLFVTGTALGRTYATSQLMADTGGDDTR